MIEKNSFCTLRHDVRCLKKIWCAKRKSLAKQKKYNSRHLPRFTMNVVFSVQRFMRRGLYITKRFNIDLYPEKWCYITLKWSIFVTSGAISLLHGTNLNSASSLRKCEISNNPGAVLSSRCSSGKILVFFIHLELVDFYYQNTFSFCFARVCSI